MAVPGNGSRIRDKTVCTRLSPSEMYILNLLTSMCDTSRSNLVRVALLVFARLSLLTIQHRGSVMVSDAMDRVGEVWDEVARLLESCRRGGLAIDPSRLAEALEVGSGSDGL